MNINNKQDLDLPSDIDMSHKEEDITCYKAFFKGLVLFRMGEIFEKGGETWFDGTLVNQNHEEAVKYYRLCIKTLGDAFIHANEHLLNLYQQGYVEDPKQETECRYNIAFLNRHSNDDEWDAPITK